MELEPKPTTLRRCAVIGRGRLGTALAGALRDAGFAVDGPLGRGADGAGADVVLLCVPDGAIAAAAALVVPGPLVGHCSGATGLEPLGDREAFSLHPLMTVTAAGARFAGATAAVDGSTARARAVARELAEALGMRAIEIAPADRAAYHAAASIASNFLVTLQGAAERLAETAGADRHALVELVRATVDNWAALGAEAALTGPVARGDDETVRRQREAVAARAPELLGLFDALTHATRRLAGRDGGEGSENGSPVAGRRGGPRSPGSLAVVRTVSELRAALAPHRRAGRTVGLVPTMGALHEGHLSLVRAARSANDVVVVSLFVNPTQFGPTEDLAAYPRDEARDAALLEAEGVDLLFAPSVEEVYPDGFATTVTVDASLTGVLCGAARPGHFDGVATVVTKLFTMVAPDRAYFGRKDAQQAVIVRRLTRDLDLPVEIHVEPIVREPDGLAMSSRNAYLDPAERERAVALRRGLDAAEAAVAAGERDAATVAARGRAVMSELGVEPEYFEIVHPDTLRPLETVDGEALVAVAARVGRARLIDNTTVRAPAATSADPQTRETSACSA